MPSSYRSPSPVLAGLCGACRHARRVSNDRGGVFVLCRLAATDAGFARYPTLPVVDCRGFTPPMRTPQTGEAEVP